MQVTKEVTNKLNSITQLIKEVQEYFSNDKIERDRPTMESYFIDLSMAKVDLVGITLAFTSAQKKQQNARLVELKTQSPKRALTDIKAQIAVEPGIPELQLCEVLFERLSALISFLNDYIQIYY